MAERPRTSNPQTDIFENADNSAMSISLSASVDGELMMFRAQKHTHQTIESLPHLYSPRLPSSTIKLTESRTIYHLIQPTAPLPLMYGDTLEAL